jgi:hypothetical protein
VILATILTAFLSSTSGSPGAPQVTQQTPAPVPPASPMSRLDDAKKTLDGIDAQSIKARKVFSSSLSSLREHFEKLVTAYGMSKTGPPPEPAASVRTTAKDDNRMDWREEFSEIERQLTYLIGGGPSTASAVGTSGVGGEPAPTDDDDDTQVKGEPRHQLEEFRRQLELFYVATIESTGAIQNDKR